MFSQNKSVFKLLQVAYEKKLTICLQDLHIYYYKPSFYFKKCSYIDLFLLDYCYSLNINIYNC